MTRRPATPPQASLDLSDDSGASPSDPEHPLFARTLRRLQKQIDKRVELAASEPERRADKAVQRDLERAAAAYADDTRTWAALREDLTERMRVVVREELASAKDLPCTSVLS